MRKTLYITLAALGIASIATAAVMSGDPSESRSDRAAQVGNAEGTTGEAGEEKKDCGRSCWFWD